MSVSMTGILILCAVHKGCQHVHSILQKIVDHKLLEVQSAKTATAISELEKQAVDARPPRDFLSALQTPGEINLIAEVKKASPSKGIIREDFDPVRIAEAYQSAGASCISVLTDEKFFQGHLSLIHI